MAEQREASLKTSEHNAATSALEASSRKEDDDEAVISLLEINFGNENGRTGNHGPADTTGGASKVLDTDAFTCNSTAAINTHISTSIDTPDLGQISSDIVKGHPANTEDTGHVRSSCSASIHVPVDEVPFSKLEVQLNVPVSPSICGSAPSDEHTSPARPSELQEASAFTDLSEKSDIVHEAGNICIQEETDLEATSATEDLTTIVEALAPEISSTSPGSLDIIKPHLEGDNSIHPASPVPDSIILPHPSDDTNTQDNLVSLPDAYTHASASTPTPSVPTTPTSPELDTSRPTTLLNSVTNTSIAAAFPLTFKHYHVFALPTAQPASPHEENSPSSPPMPPAGAFSAASVSDSTVPTDRELTVASAPTSTELSALDVDDYAVSTAENIPGPVISDLAASTDDSQIEDANQEQALLDHTTNIAKPDSPTTSAATHVPDYMHPLLPAPTAGPEPVLASASSICADVNVPASASTSEINEEISLAAVENIDSDLVGTMPMHEDASIPSTTQDGVLLASTEAVTPECARETSPERLELVAAFDENAALGTSTTLSDDVNLTSGLLPAVGFGLQTRSQVITESPASFDATTISVDSIASVPTAAGTSAEHRPVLEEEYSEGSVLVEASSALFDVPPVLHASSLSQAGSGTQTEVVETPPGNSISEECSTVDVNANKVEQPEAAGSLDEHDQDCPDPLFTVLPSSSPPSSQDLVPYLHGSLMKIDDNDINVGEEERAPDKMELDMDLDDMLPPSSPLLSSSQPRASSPDRIFDSSPLDMSGYSPPSSPQPFSAVDDKEDGLEHRLSLDAAKLDDASNKDDCGVSSAIVFGKRKLEEEEEGHSDSMIDLKKFKPEITLTLPPPPNPKRPTQASQKRQFKKLVKPFRSPLVNIEDVLAGKDAVYASGRVKSRTPGPSVPDSATTAGTGASSSSAEDARPKEEQVDDAQITAPVANKDRTAKVAKPFRAPSSSLPSSTTTPISTTSVTTSAFGGRVQAAPTIQTLQARVQKLKQALKIKASVHASAEQEGTDKLEVLTQKWRSVGREVAWLVWDSVKDVEVGGGVGRLPAKGGWDEGESPFACGGRDGSGKVRKGGFDAGWGYDDGKGRDGWGWDEKGGRSEGKDGEEVMEVDEEKEEEEDERDVPQHTLGTMLRHMGIDPDTLGWNEDEGDFVDIDDE